MASRVLRSCFNANAFCKGAFCSKSGAYINTRIVDIYELEPVGSHLSVQVIGVLHCKWSYCVGSTVLKP
jgi:hypothetical protein